MPIGKLIGRKVAFLSKQVNVFSSSLKVRVEPHECHAGDTVSVTVLLSLKKPLEARSLEARLYCVESKKVQSTRVMDSYDYREDRDVGVPRSTHLRTTTSVSERTVHSERKRLDGERTYESGEWHAEFVVPRSAHPTRHSFSHGNSKAVWKVEAKLDVPFAVDMSSSREIIVGA